MNKQEYNKRNEMYEVSKRRLITLKNNINYLEHFRIEPSLKQILGKKLPSLNKKLESAISNLEKIYSLLNKALLVNVAHHQSQQILAMDKKDVNKGGK